MKQLPLGKMIVVTGAGPSSPGCCVTKELVDAIAAACGCSAPNDLSQLDQFFQLAHDANADHYFATLRDKFSPPFVADPRVYRVLVAVGFHGYVSLDYDDLLPQAMLQARGSLDGQFTYYPQPTIFKPYDMHSQRLVAIHGFADVNIADWEKKLVLKTEDYRKAYTMDRNPDGSGGLLDWWCQMLSGMSCLFVGTSLNEPGIVSAIRYLLKDGNVSFRRQKHFCLIPLEVDYPRNEPAPGSEPLFDSIECIPYHPEDLRHRGLLRVWQEVTGVTDPEITVRRGVVPELRF
jgi:hypothetical protein